MNKINNIYEILSGGERVTLECKKATKGVPTSLWDTYSAFANTYGGTILLGVVERMDEQDNAKRFEIVGVEDADKIRKDLWNTVNSREKVNINLLYDDDIQTIDIDGRKVIAINVPRADYTVRPIYINNNLSEEKNLKDFVELFQNFKLKVIEAEAEGFDKTPSYKSELERYRSELISGYLSDKKAEDLVVEKEHERLKEFLGFDHLIFFLPAKCVSKDTVAVYQQAMEAYERICNGESFEAVGKDLMQKYPDKAVTSTSFVSPFSFVVSVPI